MHCSVLLSLLLSFLFLSSVSGQRVCPCRCRSKNLPTALTTIIDQCNRPIYSAIKCVVSDCTMSNPRMSPGIHCCDPSPSPSATPSVSPFITPLCPCICRPKGMRRTERAKNECREPKYFGVCKVADCLRKNGKFGVGCCKGDDEKVTESPQALPTPEIVRCPCICRPGLMAMTRAEKECMNLEGICNKGNCVRKSGTMGAHCCDDVMK